MRRRAVFRRERCGRPGRESHKGAARFASVPPTPDLGRILPISVGVTAGRQHVFRRRENDML